MRKGSSEIAEAFMAKRPKKLKNDETDGESLRYHGNKIAFWDGNGKDFWITNASWWTKTTKERLNQLEGVKVIQEKGQWFVNTHKGYMPWDGSPLMMKWSSMGYSPDV